MPPTKGVPVSCAMWSIIDGSQPHLWIDCWIWNFSERLWAFLSFVTGVALIRITMALCPRWLQLGGGGICIVELFFILKSIHFYLNGFLTFNYTMVIQIEFGNFNDCVCITRLIWKCLNIIANAIVGFEGKLRCHFLNALWHCSYNSVDVLYLTTELIGTFR